MKNPMDQEVLPPREGKLQRIDVTATGGVTELHANIRSDIRANGWIRVKALTVGVDFFFTNNGSATPPTYGAAGTSGVGYTLLAGTWEEFYINADDTHIAWDASGNGQLILFRCGTERVRTGT